MRFHARIAAGWLLCLLAFSAGAGEWVNGEVIKVTDGDTVVVRTARGALLRVRCYGVDTPEEANQYWPEQPRSVEAKQFMQRLLLTRVVTVRLTGDRTYGREVGEIFVDGRSATREVIRAGLGWWNRKYARQDFDLRRLEDRARTARMGLWADRNPIPPWEYRHHYHQHR